MNVSIDISMYPLSEDFKAPIIEFIRSLRRSGFHIEENGLSTQIFGPYHELMDFLKGSMFQALQNEHDCVFVMKIVSDDRKKHDPDY